MYKQANNLIKQHVPMIPLIHAGSAAACKADVTGAQAVADRRWTSSRSIKPGDRAQIVFEQNAETSGLYCGDESDGDSLRNCEQIYDALYTYKIGGTKTVPDSPPNATPNADRHGLDLHAARRREVRRWLRLRRQRRRRDVRGPVGHEEPAPRRQRRHVRLLPALWGLPQPASRLSPTPSAEAEGASRPRRPFYRQPDRSRPAA